MNYQLRPSPKWKLVVDVGNDATNESDDMDVAKLTSLLRIIETHTPQDNKSSIAGVLPGFTSLRLLLVKERRSPRENDLLKSVLACYNSYRTTGRSEADVALLTARDFMALSKDASHQVDASVASSTRSPTGLSNAQQLSSGRSPMKTSKDSTQANVNGVQYQCSSNPSHPQFLLSQLTGQQPVNNGFSALDMAISLAQNGLVHQAGPPESTLGSQQDAASLMSSLGGLIASHGTSPALHPISSHRNVAPVAISGPLADLVHHDSINITNSSSHQDINR